MNKRKTRRPRRRREALTMEDVARHAGVSAMTVSRVINREPNVSDATRATVEASIEVLGYSPNESARALAGARDVQIAILYHEPSAYVAEFLFGAFESLRTRNASSVIDKCDDTSAAEAALQRAIGSGVDGVLLQPPLADEPRILRMLDAAGVPTVVVTSSSAGDDVWAVSIDDFDAAYCMTRYLIDSGHRKIGFIAGDPAHLASGQRLAGYRAALNDAGIEQGEHRVAEGDFSFRSGQAGAAALLDVDDRPTAIFAANDQMAIGTMTVAHRLGLDVPGDISVVGFDDVPMAKAVWPELTTIHQPVAEMAAAAADLLISRILSRRAGEEDAPQRVLLDYRLVERNSVAQA